MRLKRITHTLSVPDSSIDEDKKKIVKMLSEIADCVNEQAEVIDQLVDIVVQDIASRKANNINKEKLRNLLED